MTQMCTSLLMVCGHFKFNCHVLYLSLVLDPTLKLDYVNVTWEEEYLEIGMKQFMTQVFLKLLFGLLLEPDIFRSFLLTRQSTNPRRKKTCQPYWQWIQQVCYGIF